MDQLKTGASFDGADYTDDNDKARLTGQILRVFNLMRDEHWRTLHLIALITNDPESSVSAQLRHLRKDKFGSHKVNRRKVGNRKSGLYEYQLVVNKVKSE